MKWVIAPMVAAFVFVSSAWLNELEQTTVVSSRLADASSSAPRTTADAAEELRTLPALAQITQRQAVSFNALADALAASGRRVRSLNESIAGQVSSIRRLRRALGGFDSLVACARRRLAALTATAKRVPARLGSISAVMGGLSAVQEKSIRHLRSINRKLALLGVAATATDVEVPPLPEGSTDLGPGDAPEPQNCRPS